MPRWLVCKLHDAPGKAWDGKPRLGTGPDSQTFLHYANVDNVIRFGLSQPQFTPGQYEIYLWPEGGECAKVPRLAYKKVSYNVSEPSSVSHGIGRWGNV